MIGSAFLACLEAVGVGLVMPLILMLLNPDGASGPTFAVLDRLGLEQSGWLVASLALAMLCLFVGRSVFGLVLMHHTLNIVLHSEAQLARRLLVAYLHAPLEYHVAHNSAEMQRTLDDSLRRIFKDALALSIPAVGDAVLVALVAVVLVVLAPLEAVVGGGVIAATIVVFRRLARVRTEALGDQMLRRQQDALQQVQQSLGAIREIQVTGTAPEFADNLLVLRRERADHERRVIFTELLPRYLLELGMLVSAAAVACAAFLTETSDRAIAVVALFAGAVLRMLPSLNRVLAAGTRLSVAVPNVRTVQQVLDDLGTPVEGPCDLAPLGGDESFEQLTLTDVSYRYPGGRDDTLAGLSLVVRRGDYVGVVGESGAGKTTLLNVLLGLIEPTAGVVSVNGRPMGECKDSWKQRIGYVPQDVAFLDSSVLENVALGVPPEAIDIERARQALFDAQMLEVVLALPDGIHTLVRESGARLSGGQRQRIGLARALYRGPEILILDEATSALDSGTEEALLDTLDRLRDRVTIIVVAHRPSTISRCSRVLAISAGRISSAGSLT